MFIEVLLVVTLVFIGVIVAAFVYMPEFQEGIRVVATQLAISLGFE